MPTLYEISERIRQVIEDGFSLDEETGEVFDEESLDSLRMDMVEKLEGVALYTKGLDAEAKAIREEEKALAARRRAKEGRAESLRGYMSRVMSDNKMSDMETARCRLSFRRSERVEVDDPMSIPVQYRKTVVEPDKAAIRKALKDGVTIAGARLVERENLQVR